jgi:hypothetical protein
MKIGQMGAVERVKNIQDLGLMIEDAYDQDQEKSGQGLVKDDPGHMIGKEEVDQGHTIEKE